MEIPDKLRDFINEQRQPLPPVTDPDEPLRIDSLGLMRVVAFLETEIGYTVQDEELDLQNFESLRTISKMLEGKGTKMA